MTDIQGPDQEARSLVFGERAKTYGHPKVDFSIIAGIWRAMIEGRVNILTASGRVGDIPWDEVLNAELVAIMMTGLKLARLVKSPDHHDSKVDTHGYMLTLDRVQEPEDDVGEVES